ncbi:MAG: transcription-repair coupling factor, partial [Peptococcaceae bacterium]|nr:transcription-repair coupling factor [Peptococcaceae bacterium]
MANIYDFLNKGWEMEEARAFLQKRDATLVAYQLTESQKSAYVAGLIRKGRPGCILTYSEEQALKWVNDLRALLPETEILYFPATEWLPFEMLGRSRETTAQRLAALHRLVQDNRCLLVAPVLAVERRLFTPDRWRTSCLQLAMGQQLQMSEVLRALVTSGYERVELAEGLGQIALRGGILDIAPLFGEAIRIEWFDDEIDSIRTFSLETQKSVASLEKVNIAPVLEYALSVEELRQLKWEIQARGRRALGKLRRAEQTDAYARLRKKLEQIGERLEQGILDENIYSYLSLVPEELVSIFSYLNEETMIVLDEPLRLKEQLDFQERERTEEFSRQLERGEAFIHPQDQCITFSDIVSTGGRPLLALSSLAQQVPELRSPRVVCPEARAISGSLGKTSALVEEIERRRQRGGIVALFAGDQEHGARLSQGLKEMGVQASVVEMEASLREGGVYIYPCALEQGFEMMDGKLTVFTETEIYRRDRKKALTKQKTEPKAKAVKVSEIKTGDHVVHVHHG